MGQVRGPSSLPVGRLPSYQSCKRPFRDESVRDPQGVFLALSFAVQSTNAVSIGEAVPISECLVNGLSTVNTGFYLAKILVLLRKKAVSSQVCCLKRNHSQLLVRVP